MRNKLEEIAARFNIELIVYDTARTRNALRAFFKGVRKTPAVIIGGKRYAGEMTGAGLTAAFEAAKL